jgi:hypothetical protein
VSAVRRLVIDARVDDLTQFVGKAVKEVELAEVIAFLKAGADETAFIMRVRFKDRASNPVRLRLGSHGKVQVLERAKDGTWTIYWRGRPGGGRDRLSLLKAGGYLTTPYEIRDGRLKITFLGSTKEVRAFLRFMQQTGVKYKLQMLTDAKFSPGVPWGRLTERQRKVIATAFELGYYDIPRRVGSDELAARLGISNAAFVMHRRKAERALLADLMMTKA